MQVIAERLRPLIENALPRFMLGYDHSDIQYDLNFNFVPGPQGVMPAYAIPIVVPSPLIGQKLATIAILVGWADADQETIDNVIMQAWQNLNMQKQQILATQNGGKKHG